ncbi:Splicing factor U2af large subunit A [Hirschfeldia incana]|nr:Splicing factor U2af large subunit A [Hirschfeldia incana]
MTDFEDHAGNGAAVDSFHADDNGGRGGEIEDTTDSKSQEETRDSERESSRSKEIEREKSRDKDSDRRSRDRDIDRKSKERSRDRDVERGHHRSSRHRDRSDRRERDDDDDGHRRSRDRDYDRRRDDRGDRRRRRSRSRSKDRSHRRSRSPSKRKRVSGFDMAPPASAMVAAGVASVTAQVPPAPPTIGMFPNIMSLPNGQAFGGLPMMPIQAMTQQATRHARRVYVGGLSPQANEQSVATFFSQVMAAVGGNTAGPGDAVVNVYINHEKKFAFVEMRSVEEASNAMSLDGIIFEGAPVKVKRPSDYNPSLAASLGPSHPSPHLNLAAVGLTPGASGGLEGPDRIFVGGIPYYFTELQVRELLESFGALKGLDLVKDRETGNSKGYAFCVYQDVSVTDIACVALNGIKMGDKTLTVRRANQGAMQPKPEQESILMHAQQQIAFQVNMLQPAPVATTVVCLTQVVNEDELRDDEEFEDIMEDMRQEGGKFAFCYKESAPNILRLETA